MLRQTFQHIAGFSETKERELWKKHIFTWEDYNKTYSNQLSLFTDLEIDPLLESVSKLQNDDYEYFIERLPKHLYYRIANSFPEKTIFLDIETTGLSYYYDDITLIGWSIGNNFRYSIGLETEKINLLIQDLKNAVCIVTFNGTLFDIPFIKNKISGIKFPKCHVDLRYFCRRQGYQGGQKIIEQTLKVNRPTDIHDISGKEAVILWYQYKEGNNGALKTLIKYNAFDIWGMKNILEIVCTEIVNSQGFSLENFEVYPFSRLNMEIKFVSDEITVPTYNHMDDKRISMNDLGDLSEYRVVGIDLTGSEERASGWALTEGSNALTKRIFTDKELIEESIKYQPDIISIDSPLSLPIGRISVYDDDPGRKKYGITRECERMLKKRGISSYPSLINSMQKLTERGIKLANSFRKLGYPVIESYPGAAQDIMGIPRKRKSLEYLIKGLKLFGITGDFDKPDISHDELDGITSAVVGYFFLADKYEALGNEDEDYLIIPNLKLKSETKLMRVIGVSGSLASGKTTVSKILERKGFVYSRYSLVLKNYLQSEGKEINRKNLQEFGNFVNKSKGQRWLGQLLIKQFYNPEKTEHLVIDGLRFLEDSAFLHERFGNYFFHIHIQTNENLRKERYLAINENDISFEDANSHDVERETELLLKKADIIVENNGTLEELENKINKIIK